MDTTAFTFYDALFHARVGKMHWKIFQAISAATRKFETSNREEICFLGDTTGKCADLTTD